MIHFFRSQAVFPSASSPGFIGAWWLGFFICGTLVLLATIPFWFFPRHLQSKAQENETKDNLGQDEKDEHTKVGTDKAFMSEHETKQPEKGKFDMVILLQCYTHVYVL